MGSGNLGYAMKVPEAQPVALCDVYQPHLERAEAAARKGGYSRKAVKDFREILADKSIDAVCISTPDHWHAYMTVEACKAGKDVYVEKPACVYVEEGQKMVQAARKYNRVVQAGTMQRSGGYFRKAAEIVTERRARRGHLLPRLPDRPHQAGRLRQSARQRAARRISIGTCGSGPRPRCPSTPTAGASKTATFPTFRYFWDYAGGAMTDWGVHLIDPMHQCFDEAMPLAVVAMGGKFYVRTTSKRRTRWWRRSIIPSSSTTYESRTANPLPHVRHSGNGTAIHGTEGSILLTRSNCTVIPAGKTRSSTAVTYEKDPEMGQMNVPHWKNWMECIKSRQKPTSEIETCVRSSTACILANLAMRHKCAWTGTKRTGQ